jgi:hypothetical protein
MSASARREPRLVRITAAIDGGSAIVSVMRGVTLDRAGLRSYGMCAEPINLLPVQRGKIRSDPRDFRGCRLERESRAVKDARWPQRSCHGCEAEVPEIRHSPSTKFTQNVVNAVDTGRFSIDSSSQNT